MTLKTYKVTLECCDLVTIEVEARNKKEAERLAMSDARGQVHGDTFVLYEIEKLS